MSTGPTCLKRQLGNLLLIKLDAWDLPLTKQFIKAFRKSSWNIFIQGSPLHLTTFLVMFSHSLEIVVQEMAQLA